MISEYKVEEVESQLYGRLEGRKAIRAINYGGPHMTWFPKANEGNKWSNNELEDAVKFGVWGGSVEGYGRGFNAQPCWLHFVGIDIDHKKNENAAWSAADLKRAVTEAANGVASVRTSSSGAGYHLFIHLNPEKFDNKRTAQAVATNVGARVLLPRLNVLGIDVDKVACNQLWVLGGKQEWLLFGPRHKLVDSDLDVTVRSAAEVSNTFDASTFGPLAQAFIRQLGKAATPLTHLGLIKKAVAGTKYEPPFNYAAGENYAEPNASITVDGDTLRVYSFRHGKTLFSIPTSF